MRSRYKFNELSEHMYFITWTIIGKHKIFLDSIYCEIIIDNFKFYKINKELKIFFYVIMDHHIHIIASHPKDIGSIIQNIKGFTAHEIIDRLKSENKVEILKTLKFLKKQYKTESTYQVWQEGSYPKVISSLKMLRQKIEYIHLNPVKRGFVKEPDDWYYSSARNFREKLIHLKLMNWSYKFKCQFLAFPNRVWERGILHLLPISQISCSQSPLWEHLINLL